MQCLQRVAENMTEKSVSLSNWERFRVSSDRGVTRLVGENAKRPVRWPQTTNVPITKRAHRLGWGSVKSNRRRSFARLISDGVKLSLIVG
jgi:hypothetical protein